MQTFGDSMEPMRYSVFSVQDHYPWKERTVPELYQQVVAQAELAEELGYDTFYVAEHHFHEYGVIPNPPVMLGHLAHRTRRIRLGSAISVLTFHNPLSNAEQYAMADVLSNGRVVLGVGSGYLKHEFEGYRVDPTEKRERFDENLELLRRLLSGERVNFQGKYNTIDDVQLNVLPIQKPTPPIQVAILNRVAAYHIGLRGQPVISVPYASVDRWEEIGDLVAEYQKGRAEGGHASAGPDDVMITLHTHVGDSAEAVRQAVEAPFDLYVETRLYAKRRTYDDILESGLSLFGSVSEVVDKLEQLYGWGVRHVMLLQNFGLLAPERVERSMRRIAEEVMPQLHERLAQRKAA